MVRQGCAPLHEPGHKDGTIGSLLAAATTQLGEVSDSPRLDAELLLARALDVPRSYLLAHPEDVPDEAARQRFNEALIQRAGGKPMAYITGEKDFWSLTLMVSPATLVPRPETELLVEQAVNLIPRRETRRILDLGTGSGAIALALARERPLCTLVATDQSAEALAIARENARQLDIDNVEFVHGDWVEPVTEREFDIVVSNPPYVAAGDPALARLTFEPRDALVAGDDGLDAIRRLARDTPAVLAAGGTLLLEHGADQQAQVAGILAAAGWDDVRCFRDLAGLPRVARASLHEETSDTKSGRT